MSTSLPAHASLAPIPPLADPAALVEELSRVARVLADDLVSRAREPRTEPHLRAAWSEEQQAGNTGDAFEVWRTAFADQVAASWVLAAVFVRTLEDRGFCAHRLAGPGASDRLAAYRQQFRYLGERDYLHAVFDALSLGALGREVFGRAFAPLWRLAPSNAAVAQLLDALQAPGEGGGLRFTFGRPDGVEHDGSTTRYLGDLYQDLNEGVRKRYALLQTPEFVERFILDQTLTPALAERGIGVTVIDPACGSGHFLLGAYDRLFAARAASKDSVSPGADAAAALAQVFGVDLNPYAASIARFRLLVSYLDKAGLRSAAEVPAGLHVNVYVGDALLAGKHGTLAGGEQLSLGDTARGSNGGFERTKSFVLWSAETRALLEKQRFDVVVANPPYITEKDDTKRALIRQHYAAASGKFALSAPFAERIFELANDGGWTGQITANSFMKREFGKALIEEVLPRVELTEVIDTSGAYIPGHATDTVLLFGRVRTPVGADVRVVRGGRREPSAPANPERGEVWSRIAAHHLEEGWEDAFISVARVERDALRNHPWSLGGGGAAELKEWLEERCERRLGDVADALGVMAVTGEDDIFLAESRAVWLRRGVDAAHVRGAVGGDGVRDWSIREEAVLFAHDSMGRYQEAPSAERYLWPFRTTLRRGIFFGRTREQRGLNWRELAAVLKDKLRTPLSITFAEVATHNHFVLDRGGSVFKQTAPIIKLPAGSTEIDHLSLTGVLNSSVTAFWLRQTAAPKGGSGVGRGIQAEPWMERMAFDSSKTGNVGIPPDTSRIATLSSTIDSHGRRGDALLTTALLRPGGTELRGEVLSSWARMVAIQEEIDWRVYGLFGLATVVDDAVEKGADDELPPNARAFEVRLARQIASGEVSSRWFERHGREPITDLDRLPITARQRDILSKRLALIEQHRELQILEAPEHKRRWEPFDWDAAVRDAATQHLLSASESLFETGRSHPRPLSIRDLAQRLGADPKHHAVAEVLAGSATFDLEALLGELFARDAVPSSTAHVYTDTGLEKRRLWERTWDLQRREDAGEKVEIDTPPKYAQTDFQNAAVLWRLRGKLDVPKERFIAYPTATPPPGATGAAGRVYGWAGWTHVEQLQAVISLWQDEWSEHGGRVVPRATRHALLAEHNLSVTDDLSSVAAAADPRLAADAATREKLVPLLQTMVDLLPWLRQWHNEDGSTADEYDSYVASECQRLELTREDAHLYRAPARERGRPRAATKAAPRPRKARRTATPPGESIPPDDAS